MKKSNSNICFCLLAAFLIAIVTITLAFCGLLPNVMFAAQFALCTATMVLMVLFVLSAVNSCHCTRKITTAFCRYGAALVIALIISIMLTLALLILPPYGICHFILFLIVLFLATMAFLTAMFLLVAVIYTALSLGCPRCPVVKQVKTCDEDYDDNTF